MSITQGILDIVLETAGQNSAKKVNQVNLVVGQLAQVVPECVTLYFEIMAKDTIAEGAKLDIRMVEAKAKCTSCGTVYAAEDMSVKCPECGDMLGQMISGRELAVESIDID